MEITKEEGVKLLNSINQNELLDFLYNYCISKGKDKDKTNIFLQIITMQGQLKSLVDFTVRQLLLEQNISITTLIDLRKNQIIKIF